MIGRNLSIGLGLSVSLGGSAGLPETTRAQEPPVTFPARVEQVTVDVVVADKKGNPITGLPREQDLEVYEDGVRQDDRELRRRRGRGRSGRRSPLPPQGFHEHRRRRSRAGAPS